MKADILKIAGAKNEKDFYKMFPTQKAFMAKHGAAFNKLKKAQYSAVVPPAQQTSPTPEQIKALANPFTGGSTTSFQEASTEQQYPGSMFKQPGIPSVDYANTQGPTNNYEVATGRKDTEPRDPSKFMDRAGKVAGAIGGLKGGFDALKQEQKDLNSAQAWAGVSNLYRKIPEDVNNRQTITDNAKRLRKALIPTVNAESLFPTYGVGTNVLAKGGGKLPTGGLSRGEDYGSKSHPYASVAKEDFAGGGRSYPIPTIQDAGDALRLASLHHREDVKAKVYAKYPELRKGQDGNMLERASNYIGNTLDSFDPQRLVEQITPDFEKEGILKGRNVGGVPAYQYANNIKNAGLTNLAMNYIGKKTGIKNLDDKYDMYQTGTSALKMRPTQMLTQAIGSKIPGITGNTIDSFVSPWTDKIDNYLRERLNKTNRTINARNIASVAKRMQDGGEIMNTYAPEDIYQDGGYEPLNDSQPGFDYTPLTDDEIVKAYRGGGLMRAQGGYDMSGFTGGGKGFPWESFANSASSVVGATQGNNAGNQIGGGIGEGIGSIFGPVGGSIGKLAGSFIGGALDTNPQKTEAYQKGMMRNIEQMSGISDTKNFLSGFSGVAEDGGYMDRNWNPQVITKFGDEDVSDIHSKYFGDMDTLRTGGNIRQNSVGDIEAVSGGHLEPMSYNPYADGSGMTSMIKGQTHKESNGQHTGVLLNYKAQDGADMQEPQVEAENNEPVKEIGDNAVIFGDIKISKHTTGNDPEFAKYYGKTFKKAMADIADNDAKLNKKQEKLEKEVADHNPVTPIDKLKSNSLHLMQKGIDQKYALNNALTKKASQYQEMVNEEAEARGIDAGALSRGKIAPNINLATAQKGKVVKAQRPGAWDYIQAGDTGNPEFDNPTAYDTVWTPRVKEALGDKDRAEKMLRYIENITGPGSEQIRAAVGKKATKEDKLNFLLEQATNKQVGPMHHVMNAAIRATQPGPGATPTPTGTPTAEKDKNYKVAPYQKTGWETLAGQLLPWMRKQPGEELRGDQLAGEMYALGHNQLEPVQARFYHPELDVPYDVSYQDMLNKNQADFNQMNRAVGNNPEALQALAAQKYAANQNVLGEQFRTNQAMKDRVYAGNRATLNQAQQTNLGLADQQYTRQEQAKSKTKEVAQEALNSIASKIGQNRLENRTLKTYANMFPDFSFDKNFRAQHTGAPVDWQIDQGIYNQKEGNPNYVPTLDKNGKVINYRPVEETATARHGNLVRAFKNL